MSETIPEDIAATAWNVRGKCCTEDRCFFDAGCGCLGAIARAILDERERAAQIVIEWQKQIARGERIDWHAERIAAAIRTPSTGEEQ